MFPSNTGTKIKEIFNLIFRAVSLIKKSHFSLITFTYFIIRIKTQISSF